METNGPDSKKGPFRFLDRNNRHHLWRWSTYFGRNIPIEIRRSIFDKPVFALIREFGKGIKNGKSHSYWFARFIRKMSFNFRRVFPLICDRSVWHNRAPHDSLRPSSLVNHFIFYYHTGDWGRGRYQNVTWCLI